MIKLTTPLTVEKIKQLHAGDEVLLAELSIRVVMRLINV